MIVVRQHRIFGLGKVTGRIRISNCRMLAEVNHYDFHARQLQLPIPHFYQQDPYADKYPHLSPYLYCAGNPLKYVDPSGKEIRVYISDIDYVIYKNQELYNIDNTLYEGNNPLAWSVMVDLNKLKEDDFFSERISFLEESKEIQRIKQSDGLNSFEVDELDLEKLHKPVGGIVRYNPNLTYGNYGEFSPYEGLSHELLGHAWDAAGKTDFRKVTDKKTGRYITKMYEIKAIYVENKARSLSGRKIRRTRGNRELPLLILKNPFEN